MDAARASTLIRRWWWLLAIGTVMAIAAYGVSNRIREGHADPPVYAATSRLFVSLRVPAATSADPAIVDRPFDMDRLLYTYTTLLAGSAVAERVANDLALQNAPADLQQHIEVAQPKNTQLIEVTARAGSAADADTLATATVAAFMKIRQEQQLPGDVSLYESTPAVLERNATSELLTVMLVAVAGLVAAAAIIVAFEYVSDAVRDTQDAENACGLPVLGAVPPLGRRDAPVATSSLLIDRFRLVRTNIAVRTQDAPVHTIMFAAPRASSGASDMAANYAAVLAQSGRRVVLVDADLRAGNLGERFASDVPHGLADALALDLPVYGLVDATDIDGLSLVTSGAHTSASAELLDSPRLDAILHDLRERFDAIVVAAPPLLETADATLLAARADAMVLVASCERTTRTDLAAAAVALHRIGARTLGCVLASDPAARPFRLLPFSLGSHEAVAEARA